LLLLLTVIAVQTVQKSQIANVTCDYTTVYITRQHHLWTHAIQS